MYCGPRCTAAVHNSVSPWPAIRGRDSVVATTYGSFFFFFARRPGRFITTIARLAVMGPGRCLISAAARVNAKQKAMTGGGEPRRGGRRARTTDGDDDGDDDEDGGGAQLDGPGTPVRSLTLSLSLVHL